MKIRHEVKRTVVILSAERTERTAEQNDRCHVNLLGAIKACVGMYDAGGVRVEEAEGVYKGTAERSIVLTICLDKACTNHLVDVCRDFAQTFRQECILVDNGENVKLVYMAGTRCNPRPMIDSEVIGTRLTQIPPAIAAKEDAYTRLSDGSCWAVR